MPAPKQARTEAQDRFEAEEQSRRKQENTGTWA